MAISGDPTCFIVPYVNNGMGLYYNCGAFEAQADILY